MLEFEQWHSRPKGLFLVDLQKLTAIGAPMNTCWHIILCKSHYPQASPGNVIQALSTECPFTQDVFCKLCNHILLTFYMLDPCLLSVYQFVHLSHCKCTALQAQPMLRHRCTYFAEMVHAAISKWGAQGHMQSRLYAPCSIDTCHVVAFHTLQGCCALHLAYCKYSTYWHAMQ